MKELKTPAWIVGVIDSYGAVHCKKVFMGGNKIMHGSLFPSEHHKRWRFLVREWDLTVSPGSDSLSPEDFEASLQAVKKIVSPPEWVLQGEAWEAAGRPTGEAYEKFLKNYEKKVIKSKRTK